MAEINELILKLGNKDTHALSRCITIVENELEGYQELLTLLTFPKKVPVIGITGPPGAGKSTLISAMIKYLLSKKESHRVGIIAIDPTSPFSKGSLLGDRLRMNEHFVNENVFIRSVATRGALGGLSEKVIEISDVMRAFGFDYVFIETVGVGQSEVEVAGLADTTILVLVPESGDEIQTMKSGVMEIADIFVVNKADREGAEIFSKNLVDLAHSKEKNSWVFPIIKTVAIQNEGIELLFEKIDDHQKIINTNRRQSYMYAEKAYRLIQRFRMKDVEKENLQRQIEYLMHARSDAFNLYSYVQKYTEYGL